MLGEWTSVSIFNEVAAPLVLAMIVLSGVGARAASGACRSLQGVCASGLASLAGVILIIRHGAISMTERLER